MVRPHIPLLRFAVVENILSADTSRQLLEQAQVLERALQTLQEAQDALPLPEPADVALLRQGGSLSITAHLIGLLQRVIINVENAASDLRAGIDVETLAVLDQMRLSRIEINAIESAMQERQVKAKGSHV